jgi:hypothetical protein
MLHTDRSCADEASVTIFPDGWYRIERGGRVGVGPDAESAIRDLEGQPPACEAGGSTEGEGDGRRRLG